MVIFYAQYMNCPKPESRKYSPLHTGLIRVTKSSWGPSLIRWSTESARESVGQRKKPEADIRSKFAGVPRAKVIYQDLIMKKIDA